jgi:PAS domain S-box-containing protein
MTETWTVGEIKHRTIRFKNYILFLTLAITIPFILLAVGLTGWTAAQRRAEELQELTAAGRALQQTVDGELRIAAAVLETLAASPEIDAAFNSGPESAERGAIYARAASLVRQQPDLLLNIVLLAVDGGTILDTLTPISARLPSDARKDLPEHQDQGGSGTHAGQWPEILANPGISLTPLIRRPDATGSNAGLMLPVWRNDRFAGVLAAGLLPNALGRILQKAQLPSGWIAAIADQNGDIIARSFNEAEVIGTRASPQIVEFSGSRRTEALVHGRRPDDGTLVYAALSRSRIGSWTIVCAAPRDVMDMPVWNAVTAAAGVGALALGFALVGAWALGRRMNRDMRGLITAAMALSQSGRGIPPKDPHIPRVYEIAVAHATFARAFEALREGEARLQLALGTAELGIWEWDLSRMQSRHDRVSSRISGGIVPPDQWFTDGSDEHRTWIEHTHPDDRAARQSAIDAVRAGTSNVYDVTIRMRGLDRQWHWLRMHGAIVGSGGRRLIGVVQDVSAQKDAEAELERLVTARTIALAEAEARFREVFDSQFEFIALLSLDGIINEVNRTALEACGLERGDVVGRPFWGIRIWPEEERANVRQDLAQTVQGSQIRREVEIIGAAGRAIWIDFSLKAVRNAATGAVVSIIAEGHDLTEKHSLANQLAQVQKVQALGQLAGGIAHDFNNILQAISGAALLIDRHTNDSAKIHHLTSMVINATSRGTSVTQRLLSFARRGALRAEAIDTAALLGNVREVLAHTLGSTISVEIKVSEAIPPILADRGQLDTALINLGANARDAMPDGGTLILSAKAEQVQGPEEHIAALLPGDYVRLDVSDDGHGMNAATLARVTEPFFTTKPLGAGTGLGLAMVKGFVEQSGGGLTIASAQSIGTTVSLWLRQATDTSTTIRDDKGQTPAVASAALSRILLIDDDDLVRETLADQLEDAGFSVVVAASGSEALALISAGEAIDVLITDLSMPGLNGVTTIQRARELRPRLPCFLLTGYMGERAALAAEDNFTLVRKPIALADLTAQIEARLEAANH